MYAYSNNGFSFRAVDADYLTGEGEVLFPDVATDAQLAVAFPDFSASQLAAAKAAKITELDAACAAEITGGYVSAALGSNHTYPSSITDQLNMTASVTASLLPNLDASWRTPFWCADAAGNWAYVDHSAEQIQRAGADGKAAKAAASIKLAQLAAAVNAATTTAAIAAITW
ncbi:hypothetical protein K32_23860 [Kaistia sp. 32K]|uniref:DUF4376 domain-containing protein n=1 Tax=Kaistia sp. 32K TaxID=2795690 RepID=UPI001915E4C8|nr:hypothetical protein [Kaistia sp. 32K]BCP53769.1 hypothetical protein K32_23860 [Kaistia sp. 32K]